MFLDSGPIMITVTHFTKVYGDKTAVGDLSFRVEPGEILGLMGPNGAGKTTTLRVLSGIVPPTEGVLTLKGYDIVKNPEKAKEQLAFVPDAPTLFGGLTVWEHIEFTSRVYGIRDYREKAEGLLRDFELLDHRDTMTDELSRGMQQKTLISCALLHDPNALLMDEPFTAVDPRGIRTLYEKLRTRAGEGAAIIVSSHLLKEIEHLCTRFLLIQGGRLLLEGKLEDLRAAIPSLAAEASLEDVFLEATEVKPPSVPKEDKP
jgi:ABC-2 type transport system ATP-binding protein